MTVALQVALQVASVVCAWLAVGVATTLAGYATVFLAGLAVEAEQVQEAVERARHPLVDTVGRSARMVEVIGFAVGHPVERLFGEEAGLLAGSFAVAAVFWPWNAEYLRRVLVLIREGT